MQKTKDDEIGRREGGMVGGEEEGKEDAPVQREAGAGH